MQLQHCDGPDLAQWEEILQEHDHTLHTRTHHYHLVECIEGIRSQQHKSFCLLRNQVLRLLQVEHLLLQVVSRQSLPHEVQIRQLLQRGVVPAHISRRQPRRTVEIAGVVRKVFAMDSALKSDAMIQMSLAQAKQRGLPRAQRILTIKKCQANGMVMRLTSAAASARARVSAIVL
jgi:hypothetical protein